MSLPAVPQHEQGKEKYQQEDQALIVHQSAFRKDSGYGIVSTGMPWVAAGNAFGSQPGTLASAMPLERFDGVLGAAWMKAATPAQQGTDRQAVEAHKGYQQHFHCVRRANSSSISPRKTRRSGRSSRVETRTTISIFGRWARIRRKDSRTMRRTRLRFTAERTCFFATIMPIRAVAAEPGRYNRSKCLPRRDRRKAKTDENSSVLRNRCSSRKPRPTPAAVTSDA